ncbi:hypothetical protein SUGI_0337500 [Cryptomeria japonica]|uniref:disease resistance protein RUN1-like n=1 Tax=Cryptomeria japonica TaxID=3369 RepID=UPI002408ED22|nr:disease resistance protein RUN1-like [Cryptomeria japonica]GLJ18887.1 hypothetical protein SUGI_0337500 [Cryptomeria japonica]
MDSFPQYKPLTSKIPLLNKNYHVLLSFRGEEVKKTLVDHMLESLNAIGIRVHNNKLKRDDIDDALKEAIENSDINIPIFSRSYARSSWCLQEVTRMWKSKVLIIPLFYDVQPFQVRVAESESQASRHGETLREHYPPEAMEEWKQVLHQVSNLPGWAFDSRSCFEGDLVKRIVCDVTNTFDKIPFHNVAKHPVQLEKKLQEVIRLLNLHNQADAVTVGIWGMGGCGKTTIAKAVYNHIFHCFDSCSFLPDVRNMSHKQFREQTIREVSASQRALVVLDNIDDSKQMELLIRANWGGRGSRMIVTTRDKHVLNLLHIDVIYKMEGLEYEEALRLFSWHAFLRPEPDKIYRQQSKRIVKACCGLPLAIEAAGDLLHDKKESLEYWREALRTPKSICHQKIYDVLKISYDNLTYQEKEIFVDIACIFRGKEIEQGIRYWKRLKWDAHTAITNLELKSLIMICDDDIFMMHSLLRDMGKAIRKKDNSSPFSFNRLPVLTLRFKLGAFKLCRNFCANKKLETTMVIESTRPAGRSKAITGCCFVSNEKLGLELQISV